MTNTLSYLRLMRVSKGFEISEWMPRSSLGMTNEK